MFLVYVFLLFFWFNWKDVEMSQVSTLASQLTENETLKRKIRSIFPLLFHNSSIFSGTGDSRFQNSDSTKQHTNDLIFIFLLVRLSKNKVNIEKREKTKRRRGCSGTPPVSVKPCNISFFLLLLLYKSERLIHHLYFFQVPISNNPLLNPCVFLPLFSFSLLYSESGRRTRKK